MSKYSEIKVEQDNSVETGMPLFDKLMSKKGGISLAALILMSGTSGAGKTTFSAKLQKHLKEKSMFYSREMRKTAVKEQVDRMKIGNENAEIFDVTDFPTFDDFMKEIYIKRPFVVIVDSLQHAARDYENEYGEDGAKIKIVSELTKWKDETNGAVFLIGHVNKDGTFEGVNTIKHDVDVHLHLSFNEKTGERKMKTYKNRFGELGELFYNFVDSEDAMEFSETKEDINVLESVNNIIASKIKELKSSGNENIVKEFKQFIKTIPDDISDASKTIMAINFLVSKDII